MLQWRQKAVDPPGDARSEAWFMHQLALRLIAKAKQSNDPLDEPLRALDWWYPEEEYGRSENGSRAGGNQRWYTNPDTARAAGGDSSSRDGIVFGVDREGIRITVRRSTVIHD